MKERVLLILSALTILVTSAAASVFVPYPIPQHTPLIAPSTPVRGEITGTQGQYYHFSIQPNKRYFLLVFTESIGSVEALVLDSGGFLLAQNSSPPEWMQMGHGAFIPLEILPDGAPFTKNSPLTQIKTSQTCLFVLVRWGGNYLPPTGTFIIEVVEDSVPQQNGVYSYGQGRETWPVNGAVKPLPPADTEVFTLTPGTALRGEITEKQPLSYYRFEARENKRYFVLVFPESTGDVEGYLLTEAGLVVTQNDDAPDWTQMGYGTFMAVEILPDGVPFTENSHITQIHAGLLLVMVKWGEKSPPDTGQFIIEVIEDDIPRQDGLYRYGQGRETWPFSGAILPPAYVHDPERPGKTDLKLTINGQDYYYINPSTDESLSNLEIRLSGSAAAPAEWYLAIRTFRSGKFVQYYMDRNWKWIRFDTVQSIRPFLTAVKDLDQVVVSIPSVLLYPGEYELYFAADTCLNRVPDRITSLATAELVKEE